MPNEVERRRFNFKQVPDLLNPVSNSDSFVAISTICKKATQEILNANLVVLECQVRPNKYIAAIVFFISGQLFTPATCVLLPDANGKCQIKVTNFEQNSIVGADLEVILLWKNGSNPQNIATLFIELSPTNSNDA
jgi:hypothetical protein